MLKFPTETVDEHITRIYAFGTELNVSELRERKRMF